MSKKKPASQPALSGEEMTPVAQHTGSTNGRTSEAGILDLLRSYVVMMTPDQAQHILTHKMWDRQRNIRKPHVDYLGSAIDLGELWRLIIEFAELPDGTMHLVDGYHRLSAIVKTGHSLPAVVVVSRVADEREMAKLYASIDRQKTRTMIDALRAYAIVTDTAISLETLSKISGGVAVLTSGFARDYTLQSKSQISRAEQIEQWLPDIETYLGFVKGNTKEAWNMLTRSSVTSIALATIREQPDTAEEFWQGVARDDGLTLGDPRHTLLRWLRATPVRSLPNVIVYALYVALAWNHFYAGTKLEKMIVKNKTAPMRLLGTRFTGRAESE